MTSRWRLLVVLVSTLTACDPVASTDAGTDTPPLVCEAPPTIEIGDPVGAPDPLAVPAGEARAGHVDAADLPQAESGLLVWGSGELLLANEHVAMAIEDVGPSDLYDPWGGRPTGIANVVDGALVEPGDFGELLILVGRHTVMTESVTVVNDGTDGGPAIIRAEGPLKPLPFFQPIVQSLYGDEPTDLRAAIDYELAPGAHHVDVYMNVASSLGRGFNTGGQLHGFMFTPRMPPFVLGTGFGTVGGPHAFVGFADERHTSFVYEAGGDVPLDPAIEASGFVSRLTAGRRIAPCELNRWHHARITIGRADGVVGGLDGALWARSTDRGEATRTIGGVVNDAAGAPAEGVLVHVLDDAGGLLTRSVPTGADGAYSVTVAASAAVRLEPTRTGDARVTPIAVPAGTTAVDLTMPPAGFADVTVMDEVGLVPARLQVFATGATSLPPSLSDAYGGPHALGGRLHVVFAHTGEASLRLPVGSWEIVASRGYEHELARAEVTIAAEGDREEVALMLERPIDTEGVLCGDFHIHTRRSNDSDSDAALIVRSAAAEGLELPVRSDHEYVNDFGPLIAELGLTPFLHGLSSIEMTSMQLWGHMGVFPLVADPDAVNGGAPLWQTYPTPDQPDVEVTSMSPAVVFDTVRARPEAPVVILNHPRGGTNYFGYTEFDRATGSGRAGDWDDGFNLVEVFNDSGWQSNRDGTVGDWLALLDHGREVFAVGSSDTHSIPGSPVGYPRTCMQLGTDDPGAVTPSQVRDALAAGHATISGGIYVDADVMGEGPGAHVAGVGSRTSVHVRVQAASWIDVDALVVIVDGMERDTVTILPGDADPLAPHVRYEGDLDVDVATGGSYVIVAAYGDEPLEPVHPGRMPFGVANPIFLTP